MGACEACGCLSICNRMWEHFQVGWETFHRRATFEGSFMRIPCTSQFSIFNCLSVIHAGLSLQVSCYLHTAAGCLSCKQIKQLAAHLFFVMCSQPLCLHMCGLQIDQQGRWEVHNYYRSTKHWNWTETCLLKSRGGAWTYHVTRACAILMQGAAKSTYLVTDNDLKRLGHMKKANPHKPQWSDMVLYLTSQVGVHSVWNSTITASSSLNIHAYCISNCSFGTICLRQTPSYNRVTHAKRT